MLRFIRQMHNFYYRYHFAQTGFVPILAILSSGKNQKGIRTYDFIT